MLEKLTMEKLGGLNEKEHRDFWVFRDRSKNVIYGFFGVEKFIKIFVSRSRNIQNFEKIDLQNWNLRTMWRTHVTIFKRFFCTNRLLRYAWIGHRDFRRSNVKRGHLRSNLRFRLKNSFTMTHTRLSHKNFSWYVIWCDKNIAGVKFYLRSPGVKRGHFYENRLF